MSLFLSRHMTAAAQKHPVPPWLQDVSLSRPHCAVPRNCATRARKSGPHCSGTWSHTKYSFGYVESRNDLTHKIHTSAFASDILWKSCCCFIYVLLMHEHHRMSACFMYMKNNSNRTTSNYLNQMPQLQIVSCLGYNHWSHIHIYIYIPRAPGSLIKLYLQCFGSLYAPSATLRPYVKIRVFTIFVVFMVWNKFTWMGHILALRQFFQGYNLIPSNYPLGNPFRSIPAQSPLTAVSFWLGLCGQQISPEPCYLPAFWRWHAFVFRNRHPYPAHHAGMWKDFHGFAVKNVEVTLSGHFV